MLLSPRNEVSKPARYIFACYIAVAPSLHLLAGFVVHSLLAVLVCQLASRKEGSSWEYGAAWYELRTISKNLGTQY